MKEYKKTKANIHDLENKISQLATSVNEMKSKGFDKLPSQTTINSKNVIAIT